MARLTLPCDDNEYILTPTTTFSASYSLSIHIYISSSQHDFAHIPGTSKARTRGEIDKSSKNSIRVKGSTDQLAKNATAQLMKDIAARQQKEKEAAEAKAVVAASKEKKRVDATLPVPALQTETISQVLSIPADEEKVGVDDDGGDQLGELPGGNTTGGLSLAIGGGGSSGVDMSSEGYNPFYFDRNAKSIYYRYVTPSPLSFSLLLLSYYDNDNDEYTNLCLSGSLLFPYIHFSNLNLFPTPVQCSDNTKKAPTYTPMEKRLPFVDPSLVPEVDDATSLMGKTLMMMLDNDAKLGLDVLIEEFNEKVCIPALFTSFLLLLSSSPPPPPYYYYYYYEYTDLLQSLLRALSIHIFLTFHLLLLAYIMLTIPLSSSM